MYSTSTHNINQSYYSLLVNPNYPRPKYSNTLGINVTHGENVGTKHPLSANGLEKKPSTVSYKKHPYSILFHSTNPYNTMTHNTLQANVSYKLHKRLNVRKCSDVGGLGSTDNKVCL